MANGYDSNAAYDFSRFERPVQSGSAAPARRKTGVPVKPKAPAVVKEKPKTRRQQIAETKEGVLRATKVIMGSVAVLLMFSSLLCNKVKLVEVRNRNVDLQSRLTELQQENIGLENRLNERIASYDVDEYAKTKLGMVKLSDNQVVYFNYDDADQVVLYNGKS